MTYKKSFRYAALQKKWPCGVLSFFRGNQKSVSLHSTFKNSYAARIFFRVTKNAQPTSAWLSAYAALSVNAS